ncbi:hypothetical protein [Achromobacter anxifer]|uniref:hypothetical protein n=1 Tax=Achromobacter anxifer TaxID=1287737 RepID=UPI0015924CD4|nr:hypothetical protein [Achromobacter anxifer]
MSEKNLTKERSVQRWRLAYQAMGLTAVLSLYPLTLQALEHPLLGSNPALLRLERWNLPFLKATTTATAGWMCVFLVAMMALSVWRIYSLMGVHLKDAPPPVSQTKTPAAAKRTRARKETGRGGKR